MSFGFNSGLGVARFNDSQLRQPPRNPQRASHNPIMARMIKQLEEAKQFGFAARLRINAAMENQPVDGLAIFNVNKEVLISSIFKAF